MILRTPHSTSNKKLVNRLKSILKTLAFQSKKRNYTESTINLGTSGQISSKKISIKSMKKSKANKNLIPKFKYRLSGQTRQTPLSMPRSQL